MDKINLKQKLSLFNDYWKPKVVGEVNGQHVRLAKFQGEFVWHKHDNEDELFYVVRGSFDMQYRDKVETINEGEFIIVPRGIEHCPRADDEVHIMLIEPSGTRNTGEIENERTVYDLEVLS